MRPANSGFSLVELIVVLLLLAILSLGVTVSFSAALRSARRAAMESRLAEFDRRCRDNATRFGRPVTWWIDTDRGTAGQERSDGGGNLVWPIVENDGDRVEQVWVAGESAKSGRIFIGCSVLGTTSSYAVRFRSSKGEPRWVLVAGLTGELTQGLSEDAVQQLFNLFRTPTVTDRSSRADAD